MKSWMLALCVASLLVSCNKDEPAPPLAAPAPLHSPARHVSKGTPGSNEARRTELRNRNKDVEVEAERDISSRTLEEALDKLEEEIQSR